MRYEKLASETVSLNQRIGMVLNGLDSGPLEKSLAVEFVEVCSVAGVQLADRELQMCYRAEFSADHACGCGRTW